MNKLIISCEHGGNQIPRKYENYFDQFYDVLKSHRGWDKGALQIAKCFAQKLDCPLHFSEVSRLLIEQNRSLNHPELFSEISNQFSEDEKLNLIKTYYQPYLDALELSIKTKINKGNSVIHASIHSFTPVWKGKNRKLEIGILFDPANTFEKEIADEWKNQINLRKNCWRVIFNEPYQGIDDGLTTIFRKKFPQNYAGLELEINAKLFDSYSVDEISDFLMPNFIHYTKINN